MVAVGVSWITLSVNIEILLLILMKQMYIYMKSNVCLYNLQYNQLK